MDYTLVYLMSFISCHPPIFDFLNWLILQPIDKVLNRLFMKTLEVALFDQPKTSFLFIINPCLALSHEHNVRIQYAV